MLGMGEDVVTQDPIVQSGIHSHFDQIDHFIGIFAEQDAPQDPIGARIDGWLLRRPSAMLNLLGTRNGTGWQGCHLYRVALTASLLFRNKPTQDKGG